MAKRTLQQGVAYRVAKGVEFMNKEYGRSWLRKIDPERLALEDGSACVLGQVEGEYEDGRDLLGLDNLKAAKLGFYSETQSEAPDDDEGFEKVDEEYELLNSTWHKSIVRLQKLFRITPPTRHDV
jgi:hypothetical protein